MQKVLIILSVIFVLCGLSRPAWADYYSREFGDMDASCNDFVDFEEYRYYVSSATANTFKKIDTNKDHLIDFFEWVEFQEKDYPFESKRGFKYNGRSGVWYVDQYGNRYKNRYGFRSAFRCPCNHRHHLWFRHPCGLWPGY